MLYQNDVGTQLVISGSKSNILTAEKVEAFGNFCQWHLTSFFQWHGEKVSDDDREGDVAYGEELRGRVLKEITGVKWMEYLSQWKAEKENAAVAKARDGDAYTLLQASSGLERMGLTANDSERVGSILCGSRDLYLELFNKGHRERE